MKTYITQNKSNVNKGYLIGRDEDKFIRYKAYGFEEIQIVCTEFLYDRNTTSFQTDFLLVLDKGNKDK